MFRKRGWSGDDQRADLVAAAVAGDTHAFRLLIDPDGTHCGKRVRSGTLAGLALRGVPDGARRQLLDDAWQEVALQIWKSLGSFRGESDPCTWMYRVAELTASGAGRPEKRWLGARANLSEIDDARATDTARPDTSGDADIACRLIAALRRKNEKQAKVLVLVDMLGYDYASAATAMGIKATSVPNLLFEARKNARKLLHEWGVA